MLKNYFRIALRILCRHKAFSVLNITGLAVGMSAFFLIYQYVRLETGYDSFHSKGDRIYRLVTDLKSTAGILHWHTTSSPMAINLKTDYPEITEVVRLKGSSAMLNRGDVKFQEDKTVYADSSLFSIFDFPLIAGDPSTALKEPLSIVLSQSTAKKYFGDANPIGQTILFSDSNYNAKITGVMKDLPENSSIKADLFVSMSTLRKFRDSTDYRWGSFNVVSYLLLKPGAVTAGLQTKLKPFMYRHYGAALQKEHQDYILSLEKLKEVYWSERGGFVSGSKSNVRIFSIIGLFILLLACINFVNLTTARSAERAKEVGVRKVVGAATFQLTRQFLGESFLISLISFVLSLIICSVVLPLFNQLAGKTISTGIFNQPAYVLTLFFFSLGIGMLAGIYPALVLSSFKPIASLKGRFTTGTRGLFLRKTLVVIQFTVSIAIIIGTAVVYLQLHFMRCRDLGFNKEETLVVDTHNDVHKQALRQDVLLLPGVTSATFSGSVPGNGTWSAYSQVENSRGEMQVADLDLTYVDFGFIEQYGMKLVAGRTFSKDIKTDTMQAMILNEKAVNLFGYASPQAAIGKRFNQWGKKGLIIGVVKDYNFVGLQREIAPLSICIKIEDCNFLSIKMSSHDLPPTIASIRARWNNLVPSRPFDYFFLDESFNTQYGAEERFGSLFLHFAFLAIFISCLGLLGLASYGMTQRTKEVGVRRVMGASVAGIVRLLSADFLKLILIAISIAIPVAWFAMDLWLHDFAYRISLAWWIFAGAGFGAMLIAFATIGYQAIRAAVTNPVKSLRSE